MADIPETPSHASAAKGMFGKEIAGFPLWVWLLIVGAGIGAVYLARSGKLSTLFGGASSSQTGSGLGLAIDPNTGLPYAVEGLVPAGGYAGNIPINNGSGGWPPPPPTPQPTNNAYGNPVNWQQITTTTNGVFPTMPYQMWQDTNTGTIANFAMPPPGVNPQQYWGAQGLGSQYAQFLNANPGFNPTTIGSNFNPPPSPHVVQSNWPGAGANGQVRMQ